MYKPLTVRLHTMERKRETLRARDCLESKAELLFVFLTPFSLLAVKGDIHSTNQQLPYLL